MIITSLLIHLQNSNNLFTILEYHYKYQFLIILSTLYIINFLSLSDLYNAFMTEYHFITNDFTILLIHIKTRFISIYLITIDIYYLFDISHLLYTSNYILQISSSILIQKMILKNNQFFHKYQLLLISNIILRLIANLAIY